MGAALEAGYDLGGIALCVVALALLLATKGLVQAVAGVLNVSIFGVRPFGSIANALENHVVAALNTAIRGVESITARFLSGLIDAFGMLIAIPILLGLGVKAALQYMWNHALRPVIRSITDPIADKADQAVARLNTLSRTVVEYRADAEAYARGRANAAIDVAEAYVDRHVDALGRELGGVIGESLAAAERYADQAVAKLRGAEDAAVAGAVGLAAEAKAAGLHAAELAVAEAESVAGRALTEAEKRIASAAAESQAAGQAALAGVRGIAVDVGDELHGIEGAFGAAGLAALVASIPAIATLVQTIAVETGLENAECRGKVKGICGTDPSAWGELLGGLVAVGFAFNLRELYEVARPLVDELAPIVREAV